MGYLKRKIAELRVKKVSQRRLAELAGLSEGTLSAAATGKSLTPETVDKIIDAVYIANGWSNYCKPTWNLEPMVGKPVKRQGFLSYITFGLF